MRARDVIAALLADDDLRELLAGIEDPEAKAVSTAERAMLAELDGSCRTPIGGHARLLPNGTLHLTGLVARADGSFLYTPDANFNGTDSFTYHANDGSADSNIATVTLTVAPVNDAPVAVDDAYSTNEDTALSVPAVGLLANDSDVDGDPILANLVSGPAHGTLTLFSDGSFVYTPAANFNGTDTFTYRANDGSAYLFFTP